MEERGIRLNLKMDVPYDEVPLPSITLEVF